MVAFADRLAGGWLSLTGENAKRPGEIALLRRIFLVCGVAVFAVPALLSLAISPSVAMPVGVALVVGLSLIGAVSCLGMSRLQRPAETGLPQRSTRFDDGLIAACPGLVLLFDAQASVTAMAGRDRRVFLGWMHDPAGRGFYEQVHVADRLAFMHAFDALRQGEDGACAELRVTRRMAGEPGEPQFVVVRIDMTALRDDAGELEGALAQLRDITGERELRHEADTKASEAENANDAKTRFLAAVSHELRTPLNAILGFSDILIGEYFGKLANDRQNEYVRLIRQSGAHLLSVVNTMLDMSRIEAGRYELVMEPFAVSQAVRTCEDMLGLQAREKGVTLTSRIPRGLGDVVADQRALQQVLINLVGNAVKFTESGGAVTIDAAIHGPDLVINVCDTGIGIAADKLALVGQPFVQVQNDLNRQYEGTGLGLSLVKGLIALHGGTFTIASRPGAGTVITITVPVDGSGAQGADEAAPAGKTVEFPPRLKGVAVLAGMQQKDDLHGPAEAKIA